MNAKNLLVSFLAIASVLFLVATVSAGEITNGSLIVTEVNDVSANVASVVAGENIDVTVKFTADVNDTDVTVKVEIEGEKVDADSETSVFDIESGKVYRKQLTLKVPFELKDSISDDVALTVEIDGKSHKTVADYTLRAQRPTYNAEVKSVSVSSMVRAGDNIPVDIVLKNHGYNDLDDLYVTAKIAALGVEQTSYFGDLVTIEECDDNDCDEDDTASGRLYLKVPYEALAGIYNLEIEVANDDTTTEVVKQIVVKNDFAGNVIVTNSRKTVAPGADAVYELLVVNPTDRLKVYRVVTESSGSLSSEANAAVVAIPAGTSKTVLVTANAENAGEYTFNVNVLSGETLESTVQLSLIAEGSSISSPIVILTIILAIVFIVLLVVLIVLIGKKPEKAEEFGESYY